MGIYSSLMHKYLYISILLVCFYDALLLLAIPSSATFILAEDGVCGYMVSTGIALAIGLWSLSVNGFKRLPNMWIALFIGFMVFSSFHGPNINYAGSCFVPKDSGLFNFKPMFQCLIYLLMFMGIYSAPIDQDSWHKIGKSLAWIGIIYSGYIVLQHLGCDQLYKVIDTDHRDLSRNPQDGGFISQPVFAAALLVICSPFVLRYLPGYSLFLIMLAIILTGNRSALVASVILGLYLLTGNKKVALIAIVSYSAIIALVVAIVGLYPGLHLPIPLSDSGRIPVWINVIKDIIHPIFPGIAHSYILTGLGIGAFSITFPFFHNSGFFQAHCEPLEVLYTLSAIGLFLFIMMQRSIFKRVTDHYVCASLFGIVTLYLTNPILHIPQLQFLTVLLIGLAYNRENTYVGTIS